MQHLEGSGMPVLYIGCTVLKGYPGHWMEVGGQLHALAALTLVRSHGVIE